MADGDDFNGKVIAECRANGGKVGGSSDGQPLLLLHHAGAKTGAERVNPLVYLQVGSSYAIFASAGGQPRDPQWFRNLVAGPDVTAEIGTSTVKARGRGEGTHAPFRGRRGERRASRNSSRAARPGGVTSFLAATAVRTRMFPAHPRRGADGCNRARGPYGRRAGTRAGGERRGRFSRPTVPPAPGRGRAGRRPAGAPGVGRRA